MRNTIIHEGDIDKGRDMRNRMIMKEILIKEGICGTEKEDEENMKRTREDRTKKK